MTMAEDVRPLRPGASAGEWGRAAAGFGDGPGWRCSIGLLALATDRIGVLDAEAFLAGLDGVAVFSTRLPMSPVATPETLAAMGPHLEAATALIVPGSRLDVVAFSCTSGTVAIGPERVREAIRKTRPGIPVTTPIEAGAEALRRLGCNRISLLVPYRPDTADLISGYFEGGGFMIGRKATFGLDGDPEMNRVTEDSLMREAKRVFDPASEALFISCTGLATASIVEPLEQALGRPVVTSNQALAWHALRLAGAADRMAGKGRLFQVV